MARIEWYGPLTCTRRRHAGQTALLRQKLSIPPMMTPVPTAGVRQSANDPPIPHTPTSETLGDRGAVLPLGLTPVCILMHDIDARGPPYNYPRI
jgi:hypothetical protein